MLNEICHNLSMQCRFAGAVKRFYSVAEHTVHMVRQARRRGEMPATQLALWLHDTPEYALGDVISPVKDKPGIAPVYASMERNKMNEICDDLKITRSHGNHALGLFTVKLYDRAILAAESEFVAKPQPGWNPYDPDNKLHVAFGIRIQRSAPLGHVFDFWAHEMKREYDLIQEALLK